MNKTPDGGPAFGHRTENGNCCGMTIRDYFAAAALPSAIQHELSLRSSTIAPGAFRYDAIAQAAYVIADAMVKERAKA